MLRRIEDWDDAYANAPHIPNGDAWPELWTRKAQAFRDGHANKQLSLPYGKSDRQRLDLFLPNKRACGLVVFVHGGYWMRFDRTFWSHVARGPLEHGWAVAMPSYDLTPNVRIKKIVQQVGYAVSHAALTVDGPIRLIGHSAGGHLVTRLCCDDADELLAHGVPQRIESVVSISGIHDLRPLLRLELNLTLKLDAAEARRQSPALLEPAARSNLITWVGQSERAEFVRQSELLANLWHGLGAATRSVVEPDRHHFDVVEGLADPQSSLTAALVDDVDAWA